MSLCGSQNVPPYKKLKQKSGDVDEAVREHDRLTDAIAEVRTIIDVLNFRGIAYIYKRDGGRERMANILSYLEEKAQTCKDVSFGSYDCYVSVPDYDISCDKCLATEIKMLNDMGIKTIGCCCGHRKAQGYIQVQPECEGRMEGLGYERLPVNENGQGQWCFAPKSVLLIRG